MRSRSDVGISGEMARRSGFVKSMNVIEAGTSRRLRKYLELYPGRMFLTSRQIRDMCKKYGLEWGPAELYKGRIPHRNMMEIDSFEIRAQDEGGKYYCLHTRAWDRTYAAFDSTRESATRKHRTLIRWSVVCGPSELKESKYRLYPFYSKESKLAPLDPIVFRHVKGGHLLISMWGPEAELEEVNHNN